MSPLRPAPAPQQRLGVLWSAAWRTVPEAIGRMLAAGGQALEVGCGTGLACLALAETFPAARVTGHDQDAGAIARARALARATHLDGRVRFAVDDSTRLPRAAFHLVTAEALAARVADPRRVLNAIRNALVPEGACLLLEPDTPALAASSIEALALEAGFSRLAIVPAPAGVRLHELRR